MTSLLASLHTIGFHVEVDHWQPSTSTLMDKLLSFSFPIEKIRIFNKVRVAFELLYESDAFSVSGTSLLPFLDEQRVRRQSHLHWPTRIVSMNEKLIFTSILTSICSRSISPSIRSASPYTVQNGRVLDNQVAILGRRVTLDPRVTYMIDLLRTPE